MRKEAAETQRHREELEADIRREACEMQQRKEL